MTRRGIQRRRLEDDLIISNIKQMIAKYRAQGIRSNVNRQALYAIVKYVMGPTNAVGSSILKRYLGISSQMWKRIGEKQSMISCVMYCSWTSWLAKDSIGNKFRSVKCQISEPVA